MSKNKIALALVMVLVVIVSTWGGIVLADDNWSTEYDEVNGATLDLNPGSMTVIARTCSSLTVQLVKSADAPRTYVRYSDTASPTTRASGYLAYDGTAASFVFSPIVPAGDVGGHIYYLSAWGYDDTLGWSVNYTTLTDYTLPCDPTGLVASVVSDTRIDLSWTKGLGGDKVELYYRANAYPASRADPLATLGYFGTSSSCSITGLTTGVDYYFRVWAYDTHSSYYSAGYAQADASATGIPVVSTQEATYITPTTARINGYVDYAGGSTCWVRFQWGAGSLTDNTSWQEGKVTGESVYYDLSGLTILTNYHFRVQAYNIVTGIGSPESGSTLEFTTCDDVGDPTYLFADPVSSTEIDLSWIVGSCSDRSIVRYSPTDYPASENTDLSAYYGVESVCSLDGLSPGTTYYFRVWSTEQTGNYVSDNYSEAVATTPAGGGGSVPYTFGDTSNWFTDPDCSRITGIPFYSGVADAATGIGWDICVMFVFIIFILTIVAGLVTAIASKGNLTAVLVVMGMVLLIGVVAGPLPKAWFIIYLALSIPTGYLLPKGAGV